MNNKDAESIIEQVSEQTLQTSSSEPEQSAKKLFVEPTVSAAVDVLETTTFFQQPTIEASTV